MYSKCGMYDDVHIDFCKRVMKRPHISQQAGKLFAERVQSQCLTTDFLVDTLEGSVSNNGLITPFNSLSLHGPFDSNNQLAVTTIPYKSAKHN